MQMSTRSCTRANLGKPTAKKKTFQKPKIVPDVGDA